jgi:DnaJ homolog subfamily A member 2
MPSFRHHDFGNLYIQFDVKFPASEELRHLELLEKVLPPRPRQSQPPADAMIEDFDLEEVDPRGQARAQGASGGDDEEEDGIPHGAERMQCASQ